MSGYRPPARGFSKDAASKVDAKYPKELEGDARRWVETMYGDTVAWGEERPNQRPGETFAEPLRSGVILCKIANKIKSNAIPKIGESNKSFVMQENISKFLDFCERVLGLDRLNLFQTVDLFERQNVGMVITTLQAVSRKANALHDDLPLFGPKEGSGPNPREFTEEQLKAAKAKGALR